MAKHAIPKIPKTLQGSPRTQKHFTVYMFWSKFSVELSQDNTVLDSCIPLPKAMNTRLVDKTQPDGKGI